MNIINSRVDFTGEINPGRLAYIIEVDNSGINLSIDELADKAVLYARVVIRGIHSLKQKDELIKFIRKISKQKSGIIIEINTTGLYKPLTGCGDANINYNVNLFLKNSGIEFNERIKRDIILQYIQTEANFIFYVHNEDEIDEVNLLVKDLGIKKERVYLSPPQLDGEAYLSVMLLIIKYAKLYGYNFSFDLFNVYWKGMIDGQRTID